MRLAAAGLITAGFLVGSSAFGAEYDVDQKQSLLVVRTYKDGVAARLAHDHLIQATEFSGLVNYDPAAADGASISVEAKTASLKVDETPLRKKLGADGELKDGDRKDITKNMQSEDQLHISKYPTIMFKSTGIKKQADGTYLVNGKLTLRGKTNDVSFPAKVDMQGANFHATGSFKFTQKSFGFDPYSAMFGAVKNKDEVQMILDIVATPRAAPAAAVLAPAPAAAPASSGPPAAAPAPKK